MELEVINYQSPLYSEVLLLRQEVLRKPLGLNLFDEDLTEERDQYIIVVENEGMVIACLMIKILDTQTVKFRQMAVRSDSQKQGLGSMLINYAENFCQLNDYRMIELNARDTAIPFYERLGYTVQGDVFEEVGIAHHKMHKALRDDL